MSDPLIQLGIDADYRSTLLFIWNCFSRLILLEILVLTLGRIRPEVSRPEGRGKETVETRP